MSAHFSRYFKSIIRIALFVVFVVTLLSASPAIVHAAGVVGDGNPATCTAAALASAISAGNGTVTFNCGAAPVTIVVPQPNGLVIQTGTQTTIDGNHLVVLSGGLASRVFIVDGGGSLTLQNLSVVKGYSPNLDGGAILNVGTLIINGCTFSDNLAGDAWSGGAILSYGPLTITNSEFRNNQAGNGGAIYPRLAAAVTTITGTTFDFNTATNASNGWGGALLMWDGAPVTLNQDNFHDNTARIFGGAIFSEGASNLTVSNSQFSNNSGQVSLSTGGAIYTQGTLSVTGSTFSTNHADNGGAIFMETGVTNIFNSIFAHNWAVLGGAYQQGAGTLTASDSWFYGNGYDLAGSPVTASGGALYNVGGTTTLTNLTINGNWATVGGGFYQSGTSILQNVTISNNHANFGGGISQHAGDMTLTNVTIYQNSAANINGGVEHNFGTATVNNTIIANNSGGNCGAPFTSFAFDLSSDGSCGFGPGRDNMTIGLASLYNTGGSAPTHLPFANSPAVDNASGLYCPIADQRGVLRAGQGSACDVGAVERVRGEKGPAAFLPLLRK